jgi:pyruvate dehydrogenase E2 component (dihydrolipoamide acetyltransferase)
MEVNMSGSLNSIHGIQRDNGSRIPITALLAHIAAKALRSYPIINSILENDQIKIIKDVNIGIAVSVEDGLVVPVLHYADEKSLLETAKLVKELIQKAKARTLSAEELKGGTLTITNLGSFGVDAFTPIINPPQTAIIGVGTISNKPIALESGIGVAPMMVLTLVFDHRVYDGAKAAAFLKKIKELLESFQ